jgi:adenylyltransferase/sulfurtransferase
MFLKPIAELSLRLDLFFSASNCYQAESNNLSRGILPMTIYIPTPLRVYTGGQDAVEVDAATVDQALEALTQAHPDLRKHLFTPEGKVRAFVNLYLNDEDVRYLPAKEATAVTAADTLSIIPSIAGGLSPGLTRLRRLCLRQ